MKKIALLLSAGIVSLTAAQAQQTAGGAMSSTDYAPASTASRNNSFGVKGGLNLSNVYGDDKPAGRENLNSFHAGVFGQVGITNKVSIQPEILYSRKGYRYMDATQGESNRRYDYIQVPVLFVYNFLDHVSFHVGPQVSLMTKYRDAQGEKKISAAGLNSFDYGAVAGIEGRMGPARIGVRYDLGAGKILESGNNRLYNNTFQAYVGLGFSN